MRTWMQVLLFLAGMAMPWCAQAQHAADTTLPEQVFSLSELIRVVQLYNADELHCDAGAEDGYAIGPGDTACPSHSSDYAPQDWRISLSELLRLIQLYNAQAYHCCAETPSEDGYCPGVGEGTCPGGLDSTPPVLTLLGPLTVAVPCGQDFIDPGASALDDTDGDLGAEISVDLSEVDPLGTGIRTVTYTVSDAAGNVATRTRRVFSLCETPVGIPDPFLEAAVRDAIAKPNGDLLPADLSAPAFTELNAATLGITDLTGLEYAIALTALDLHGNCVSNPDALSHLDGLQRLNLHDNDIVEVTALRYLESLSLLWLGRNQIADISPLAANAGLAGDDDAQQWDRINLTFNPLAPESAAHIDALESRGAAVWHSPIATPDKGASSPARSARVTLAYDDGEVYLTGLVEFDGSTPLPDAPRPGEPRLEIRDATRTILPVPLRFGLDVTSCGLDAPDGVSVGDFESRATAELSITVPITGAVSRIDYIASATAPGEILYPASKFSPKGLPCGAADEPGDPIPVGAKLVHGNPALPDERAFVLLIMGDAFPEEELGKPNAPLALNNTHYIPYAEAVADSMNFVLAQEPFANFAAWMKIYRVDLVSRDNRPSDANTERDTALRMFRKTVGFDYDQALCARVASNTGIAWDKIVLLPNGNGSGTQTADFIVYSNFSPSRKMTALHEFGHGIGDLADEYEYRHGTNPPESYAPADVTEPNAIARNLVIPSFDDIPWRHWLEDTQSDTCQPVTLGDAVDFDCVADSVTTCQCAPAPVLETDCVPLLTCEPDGDYVAPDGKLYGRIAWPEPGAFPSVVGLFEGSKYRRKGAYRPELRCRMRSDDDVEPGLQETPLFCRVCREHLIAQMLLRAGNVATATPDPATPRTGAGPHLLAITLHGPAAPEHTPVVQEWRIDGVPIPNETGLSLQLNPDSLSAGDHTVSVITRNPTPWLHPGFTLGQEAATQTLSWTVTVE